MRRIDDAVEEGQGIDQHGPNVLISFRGEAAGQIQIGRQRHQAGDCGRPGVVDQIESFDRRECVQALKQSLQEARAIVDPVKSVSPFVDDHQLGLSRTGHTLISSSEQHPAGIRLISRLNPKLDGHLPEAGGRVGKIGKALLR